MYFYLIGIDYNRADIGLREQVYARRKEILAFYNGIFSECALLSTCNRFEVYGAGIYIGKDIYRSLLPAPQAWYLLSGESEVLRHALRLAAGLESQLKGETQILEQIDHWRKSLPENLAGLWERAYLEAKDIRAQAGLGRQVYNIATLIFEDLRKYSYADKQLKIIVVGTGKIAQSLARHRPSFAHLTFAAHKNFPRARELAEYAQGKAVSLRDLTQRPPEADVLISATSSPHPVFKKDDIAQIALRQDRTLYIYDLAIPRDIEPAAGAIKGVSLKNLDDLSGAFAEYSKERQREFNLAEYLIEERIKEYEESFKNRHPAERLSLKTG